MFNDKEVREARDYYQKHMDKYGYDNPCELTMVKLATAYLDGKLQPKWDVESLSKMIYQMINNGLDDKDSRFDNGLCRDLADAILAGQKENDNAKV